MPKAVIAALCFLLASVSVTRAQTVEILTGDRSGIYYGFGKALAQAYRDVGQRGKVEVVPTAGSMENIRRLLQGEEEFAFTQWDVLTLAATQKNAGRRTLRAVAAVHPDYMHLVARGSAGIQGLTDLKGRRVAFGPRGSGTDITARRLLAAAGFRIDDLGEVVRDTFRVSTDDLKRSILDAAFVSAGLGVPVVAQALKPADLVLVPIPAEVVQAVGDASLAATTIPANTYPGQTRDVPTAAVRNLLIVHSEVPDDVVYTMTRALFEKHKDLVESVPATGSVQLEARALATPVPLHPGALRFYKEKGFQVP